jgi:hypothetical protein
LPHHAINRKRDALFTVAKTHKTRLMRAGFARSSFDDEVGDDEGGDDEGGDDEGGDDEGGLAPAFSKPFRYCNVSGVKSQ